MDNEFSQSIYPPNYQKTRGLYSPAKKVNMGNYYLIFISGHQATKDPVTHDIIMDGIEEQTESAFENFTATVEAAGATLENIAQLTLYLSNLDDLEIVTKIKEKWITSSNYICNVVKMTRGTRVGSKIEIDGVAILITKLDADISQAISLVSKIDEQRRKR